MSFGEPLRTAVASYHGTVSIGATADRSALPDPAYYAECMRMQTAFDELLSAVRGRSRSTIS